MGQAWSPYSEFWLTWWSQWTMWCIWWTWCHGSHDRQCGAYGELGVMAATIDNVVHMVDMMSWQPQWTMWCILWTWCHGGDANVLFLPKKMGRWKKTKTIVRRRKYQFGSQEEEILFTLPKKQQKLAAEKIGHQQSNILAAIRRK